MTITKSLLGAISICTAVFMSGCGGGGSSSGGNSGLPALDVPAAEATQANGEEAVDTILGMDGYASGIGFLSASSSESSKGFDLVSFGIEQGKRLQSADLSYALNASDSYTYDCYDSGSISYSVSYSSSSVSGTITYDHCVEYGVAMNGQIKMSETGDLENYVLDTLAESFTTDFTIDYGDSVYTIHKGTYIDYDFSTFDYWNDVDAGVVKSSLWISYGDLNYRYDDLTVGFEDDYYYGEFTRCYKAGRIYVNNLSGYLDIDSTYDSSCSDPFVWDYYNSYGLVSGSMELVGSNETRVHVEVTATNTIEVTTSAN